MINVTLGSSDSKHIESIRELCSNLVDRDVNFNGAQIEVWQDNFTSVDDSDEIRGSQLLAAVYGKIAELEGRT